MSESSQEIGLNPDGRLNPVFYEKIIIRQDGTIERKRIRIVGTDIAVFPYKAVDPETGNEVPLGKNQWVEVYRGLLNKEPPDDLSQRVAKYHRIRLAKEKERLRKNTPIETPF